MDAETFRRAVEKSRGIRQAGDISSENDDWSDLDRFHSGEPVGIVDRLRNYESCHDGDVDEAADMLEFFFGQMQITSAKMDGNHFWRLTNGWPMGSSCRGRTKEEAIRFAIKAVKEEKQ